MVSCLFSLNKYFNFLASWCHKPCCKCSPTSVRASLAYVHRGGTAGSMRWADLISLHEAGWWDKFISPLAILEGSCFFFFFTFSLWSNLVHINYLPPAPTGGWMHLIVFICISLIMNLGIFSYFSYSFVFPCHLYSAYSHPFPNFSSCWVTDFFLYVLDMSILDIKHIF